MLNMRDIEAQAKALAPVIASLVAREVEASHKGLLDLIEQKNAQIASLVSELEKSVANMPTPKDGKDADPGVIRAMVSEAVSEIPPPRDGVSVSIDDVRPILDESLAEIKREASEAIEAAIRAIPVPENGKDGEPGKDGKSFDLDDAEKLLDSKMARWELDFERRANDALQRAIDRMPAPKDGKDGEPGKDGVDGVGFDDLEVEYDGERAISLVFTKGERVKRFDLSLPVVIDRGIYKSDMDVKAGDGVTWGGSYWIAQKDMPTGKPGDPGSEGWRLAVKRGRDGKDGRNGIDFTKPVKVEVKE